MSVAGTLWKVICGGSCCGCCCAHAGENTNKTFPRNQKELEKFGAGWLTKVLTDSGKLTDGVTVTSLTFQDNNDGGLLGEMCVVEVTYSGQTKLPKKMMAKFRPPDTETRITTSMFDLCQNEFDFYRTVAPTLSDIIRIPEMIFGDFHRPSATFIMLFEYIQADFGRIQNDISRDRCEMIMKAMAKIHSTFWGGTYSGANVDFIHRSDYGAFKMIPKVSKDKSKTWDSGLVAASVKAAPKEIQDFVAKFTKDVGAMSKISLFLSDSKLTTITHGDPRIDNFFFNETGPSDNEILNEIGILDWQLMVKLSCVADLSWFFSTTIAADSEVSEGLIEIYYEELTRLRAEAEDGEPLPPIEKFKEELAIAHLSSLLKIVIGAGGLNKNDQNTVEVMNLLVQRNLKALEVHGSIKYFQKLTSNGNSIVQHQRVPRMLEMS